MFTVFIERPVLTTVISILLMIVGALALWKLPIQQFPNIAPPTVQVTALYPGANAETLLRSVAPSLEESINGVENIMYLKSTASNDGTLVIQVNFTLGIDPDQAAVNVQTQVVAQIAEGYYNLLILDTQLAVVRRNFSLTDSTLRFTRLQFAAGQVTALAVQQVEAQRLTAAGLIPEFEQAITVQEDALSILAGRLPGGISRTGNLLQVQVPVAAAGGVPAALLARRPDVRSAELALDRANATVGYTKAQLYPTLAITAQGGLNAFQAINWFSVPASLFGTVFGGLTQPLFQRGALRTQYQQAKFDRERTVIQFRQKVLVAVGEVSNALGQITRTQTQQAIATDRVNTLHQATTNANVLFRSGLASYLEVITAQSNALQSELELASLKRTQLEANAELYRAVGGGWQ